MRIHINVTRWFIICLWNGVSFFLDQQQLKQDCDKIIVRFKEHIIEVPVKEFTGITGSYFSLSSPPWSQGSPAHNEGVKSEGLKS